MLFAQVFKPPPKIIPARDPKQCQKKKENNEGS